MKRPTRKTLTRKLDAAWSLRVRSRGSCERCERSEGKLDAHHMIGKRRHIVRWNLRNGICLCVPCHRLLEEDPFEAVSWLSMQRAADVVYVNDRKHLRANFTDRQLLAMLTELVRPVADERARKAA